MAIANANFAPLPVGAPALSQGTTVQSPVTVEPFAAGIATLIGDGASTTATINFIDGVQALSFTPSAVFVSAVAGGTAAATINVANQQVSSLTATSFGVTLSAAPANLATLKLLVVLYR